MELTRLKAIGLAHLEEHLPRRFEELVESGQLEEYLDRAAANTKADVDATLAAGFSPEEAWQMVRERYLLLPAEPAIDDANDPLPDRDIFSALRDLNRGWNDTLQDDT